MNKESFYYDKLTPDEWRLLKIYTALEVPTRGYTFQQILDTYSSLSSFIYHRRWTEQNNLFMNDVYQKSRT